MDLLCIDNDDSKEALIMADNNILLFSDSKQFKWGKGDLMLMIRDGEFDQMAYLWAKTDAKLIANRTNGELKHMDNFHLCWFLIPFYNYYALFHDKEKKEMIAVLWDLTDNSRSYTMVDNYEQILAEAERNPDRYAELLRNGAYLYIMANHPKMVEAIGWEKPTFHFTWTNDWSILRWEKEKKIKKKETE